MKTETTGRKHGVAGAAVLAAVLAKAGVATAAEIVALHPPRMTAPTDADEQCRHDDEHERADEGTECPHCGAEGQNAVLYDICTECGESLPFMGIGGM